MSAFKRYAGNRRLVSLITSLWVVLTHGKENRYPGGILVKRDTTLDNVKAMYNRFVSESTGKAKYADAGTNACSMDMPPSVTNSPGIIHVAASKDDFQASLGCGVCLKITGSGKPAAADLDGSPPVQGDLKGIIVDQDDSLSQGDLALLPPQSGSGLWEINFKAADCPTARGPTGYIQFRFTGSNEMYFKLQASNAKVPVAGIEAYERVKDKWFCLTRTTNNYFTSEGMGAVSFPLKVRLTSIMNEQLEVTVEALKNDVIINSDIQFSDTEVRGGSPEGIKCYGQGERRQATEGDEGFCVSKEDGIYADPEDETAFYVCQGEKATKKFCPTGLKFNPVISSCDVPEDVKFVGSDTDSTGSLDTKENSKWVSIPGNGGFKVLSVGESERPTKEEDKAVSNAPQPHKLFSINIFNVAHTQATNKSPEETENKFSSRERFQGNRQDNVVNITSVETTPQIDNSKKLELATAIDVQSKEHERLRNTTNRKTNDSLSLPIAQKIQSTGNGSLNHQTNQKEWRNFGESALNSPYSSSKHLFHPESFNVLPKGADIKLQGDIKADRNSNSFQGHLSTPPHKVFAINIYGSHPQVNEMQTAGENRLDGERKLELADQFRDTSSFNNGRKVLVDPLDSHSDDGEVFKNPGHYKPVNDYDAGNSNHVGVGSETVVQDLVSTNDSNSSMPLHFKLKINMENNGKQPVINCTLSECTENDFAIQEDKTKDLKAPVNGSATESTGTLQKLFGGRDNPGDLHLTFKTGSPESMTQPQEEKGPHVSPKNSTELIMPPSKPNSANSPSQFKEKSQTAIQSLNSSRKSEHKGNDTAALSTNENREQNEVRPQHNAKTNDGDVVQHGEHGDGNEEVNLQESTTDEGTASNNNSSIDSRAPLSGKYKAVVDMLRPSVNANEYNDKKLELNADQVKVPKKVNEQKENQFYEPEQLSHQDFVQIQSHPQLKIILKNPGKILNPLRRRSDAKENHIVQILKSLIDRPLKLGSKNKEVVSMLSSLANKPVSGTTRENIPQEDSKEIEDSGNIAQSILEANKEYLDAVAMQGMVFSDGDPETENMTNIEGSINHSHGYNQQEYEASLWKSKGSSSKPHEQSLDNNSHQDDWLNGEHVITQLQDDGGSGESTSGMGNNKDSGSGKRGRADGSGSLTDVQVNGFNDRVNVPITVWQYGASEVNSYKGGMPKPKSNPKLKSFCIGKSSGIYKNPFERKSFVICTNGVSEERECPGAMLFNPKEKMCDVPDQKNTARTKKKRRRALRKAVVLANFNNVVKHLRARKMG